MMTNENSANTIHKFEAAGLGKAPFRCIGSYRSIYQAVPGASDCPIQPGSSCDYCGNAIMQVYQIRGADGREFKVGCDCVAKTGDAGLKKQVNTKKAAHNRELRKARIERTKESLKASAETTHADLLARLARLEAFGGFHASFAKSIARQLRAGLLAAPSTRQMALIEKLAAEKGV